MIYKTFTPHAVLSDVVDCCCYVKGSVSTPLVQTFATPLMQTVAFNFNMDQDAYVLRDHTDKLDKQAYFLGSTPIPAALPFAVKLMY